AQGMMTLHSGLVRSCNTVFYQLGAELDNFDPNALPEMSRAFGLGQVTGIPYYPEVAGTIPDPQWKLDVIGYGWSTGDAVILAIGFLMIRRPP
ncbi:penicillin-binding transpeptidase domain-containing protein, partial [Klebsiella pneumoniae]|uniref:penicillin-binding transpeptidase domain-containing protein n=1 Tax=Klebsiella pneumoniae TaxID=573 RepID=UPI003B5BBDED